MKKHSRYTPCLQTRQPHPVPAVLRNLVGSPWRNLILRWNSKVALLSSIFRANIFFAASLTAGWKAAGAAMTSEFVFRACTSGFYGVITQGLGEADPAWAAGLTVMFLVPLISHSLEFLVHFLRGTPNLLASIIASASFTAISTLVNWYAMRHGTFTVGEGQPSLLEDLRRLSGMLFGLLTARPNP